MGNICPLLQQQQQQSGSGPTERSGLIANQHAAVRQPQQQQQPQPHASSVSSAHPRDPGAPAYTARSITNTKVKSSDSHELAFGKIGLENLDRRLSDISSLFNSLLERYSNLKTGLLQLDQFAREICAKQQDDGIDGLQASLGTEEALGSAFACFARRIAQTADSEAPVSVKLKQHAKHWMEAAFDSKCLQYDEIGFLNLYNLLGRYAWELRSKTPPLRNTVAMTTQEEETFRRDLLVASLNSEANAFGANFARLRHVDEQLGGFERLGADAGERLSEAAGKLLLA